MGLDESAGPHISAAIIAAGDERRSQLSHALSTALSVPHTAEQRDMSYEAM